MTTSTTTTLPPKTLSIKQVETVVVTRTKTQSEQDGSDSKSTLNTIDSHALSLGPLAPGETSETKIIYLNVPSAVAINHIKIALIDTGGITFGSEIFGVEIESYLDYNIVPSTYFGGINGDDSSTNANNINVANNGSKKSQYVYLNVSLPENQTMGGGVVRFRWYFDYT